MKIIADSETKINTWNAHKRYAVRVARHMTLAAASIPSLKGRAERMRNCGNKLIYKIENGHMIYGGASLCRDRLCPLCAWRLSIKRTGEMINTAALLAERYPHTKAIHVVLTVRNVHADELREALQQMTQGFTRLKKLKLWRDYVCGYMRSVEVTYNADTDTYHPHIHVICIVEDRYTRQISIGDWIDMWQDSARLCYRPIVWATAAYRKPAPVEAACMAYPTEELSAQDGAAASAIVEATKYAIKPAAINDLAASGELGEIALAMRGVRMISFGGIVKKLRAELGYSTKDEPEEQIPPAVIVPEAGIDRYYLIYTWSGAAWRYVAELRSALTGERIDGIM